MIAATDLKAGATFLHQSKPYQVVKYEHIKVGRGGATVRVTVRNLESGGTEEKTFSSDVKVDEVNTYKKKLQFLYRTASSCVFVDTKTYEQTEIPLSVLGDSINFIKEGESIDIFFWDERPLSFELPPKITLMVSECDPGVKGNSATNIYKPATLENGMKIKVPLFINLGDKIKVDTRTGAYVERAKE
ncbi:elongation factor P [Candidatus Woesebacteria bacterium RIFCSPHIGHO2_12_FULL_46_16]|uniref:Elongation factor P n=1 Tax=Candidatus Woesebacteria bacterium RIFCSPHIGHO2_12_FULL_46_16 TaxID=1802513 RepID=A0A1F8AXN7_9BACT|nr:MAG: elongation factor P [Candidatus Woesebacteria bacterium RIFCSPHIGHO2_12_FULL_46_16]